MLVKCYILVILCVYCRADEFRYDYKFYPEIDGSMKLHRMPMVWDKARFQCYYEGGVLLSPLNKRVTVAIQKMLEGEGIVPEMMFSGVSAMLSNGILTSVEGIPIERMSITWALKEPAYFETSCLVFFTNGSMGTKNCNEPLPYICFRENRIKPLNDCGTDDDGYKLDANTNRCYKFHPEEATWGMAYAFCQAEGGYLAITHNVTSETLLDGFSHISGRNQKLAAIGIRNINGNSWDVQGKPARYVKFSQHDTGECAAVTSDKGKFIAISCYRRLPFICEKAIDSLLVSTNGSF